MHRTSFLAAALVAPALSVSDLVAQCPTTVAAGLGLPGVSDVVNVAHRWDPDGPGPQTEKVVLGGEFVVAGLERSPLLALLDPATGQLSALPNTEFYGVEVEAIVTMPNGDLVVGGYFGNTGQTIAQGIARFDGQNWSPLGAGVGQNVRALAVLPNGDLIAAGEFTLGNSAGSCAIARWDGSQWSTIGVGASVGSAFVNTAFVAGNGDLYVGGNFLAISGVQANNIARWDGTQWHPVGGGAGSIVHDITEDTNGNLIVCGQFFEFDGIPCGMIVRQNGATWTPLFPVPALQVGGITDVIARPNGQLIACGASFTFSGASVGIYDGSSWIIPPPLGSETTGAGICRAICELANGEVVCGGLFRMAGGVPCSHVAQLDPDLSGPSWSSYGDGSNGQVRDLLRTSDDVVYAGGDFTVLDGTPALHLARRAPGGTWQEFGAPINASVHRMLELPNGDLIVAGGFTTIGGIAANRIARWDGSQWHALGAGSTFEVRELAVDRNGDLIALGWFQINNTPGFGGRWDGTAWQPFGAGQPLLGGGVINSLGSFLTSSPDGDVYALAFTTPNANEVIRWDGTNYSRYAPAALGGSTLLTLPAGELVSGSSVWDGTAWQVLPIGGVVAAAAARPDGQTWLTTVASPGVARLYSGTLNGGWQLLEEGPHSINAIATERDGTLLLGGHLINYGGSGSAFLTRVEPSCAAAVAAAGTGCLGSNGLIDQQATQFAWAGGAASAELTGPPAGSLLLHALGFAPQVLPLPPVLPQAQPNCTLWHTADVLLGPDVATGAPSALTVPLPNVPALAGMAYHTQAAVLELDAGGSLQSVAVSNALRWTIGAFQ